MGRSSTKLESFPRERINPGPRCHPRAGPRPASRAGDPPSMSSTCRRWATAAGVVLFLLVWGRASSTWGQEPTAGGDTVAAAPDVPRVVANESILRWGARASGPIGLV